MRHLVTLVLLIICRSVFAPDLSENQKPILFKAEKIPDFASMPFSPDNLYAMLHYYVMYPDIVFRQAVHETGHFSSEIFREANNLFGMNNPRSRETTSKGSYRGFAMHDHWSESVIDYRMWQEYYYHRIEKHQDYYSFLKQVGYAKDQLYNPKLKRLNISRYLNTTFEIDYEFKITTKMALKEPHQDRIKRIVYELNEKNVTPLSETIFTVNKMWPETFMYKAFETIDYHEETLKFLNWLVDNKKAAVGEVLDSMYYLATVRNELGKQRIHYEFFKRNLLPKNGLMPALQKRKKS